MRSIVGFCVIAISLSGFCASAFALENSSKTTRPVNPPVKTNPPKGVKWGDPSKNSETNPLAGWDKPPTAQKSQ
jgi:hypothetical protein